MNASIKGAASADKISYVLRDVIGREVGRGTAAGKGGSISLAGLHPGIYMVSLRSGSINETFKLVVE